MADQYQHTPEFHASGSGIPPENASRKEFSSSSQDHTGSSAIKVSCRDAMSSVGSPTTLVCLVHGDVMKSTDVEWFHNGERCKDGKYRVMKDSEHYCYLYIDNTTTTTTCSGNSDGGGDYRIVARNDQGKCEEVITLSMVDLTPPKRDENHLELQIHQFLDMLPKYLSSYTMREDFFDIELPMKLTQHAANLPCNIYKNRYCNVFPYDHTRVVLSLLEDTPGSDYVNASHIDDIYTPKGYIASQGPIPNTFEDHWRMILECNVNVMAMVTRTTEKKSIKCHQYWPSKGSATYGRYCVSLKAEEILPYCAIRTFLISDKCASKDQSHEVKQFQFLSWPEYGVPSRATELLDFRKRVFECHSSVLGPLLVHCSAGVGRTGTFICVDSILKRIESDGTVDVFNFIRQLRFKRERTVETEEQYKFIHGVLAEYLTAKH